MVQFNHDESCGAHNYYEEFCSNANSFKGDEQDCPNYMHSNWAQIAETTLPLKASKLAAANHGNFQASIELRSRKISKTIIVVNLISLLVNLILAVIAFYFSFTNNSPSTTAFAADCVLDFISSAIVLWRYYGDLNSVYLNAREQIACVYLGALFELSALGIIIKAISDISWASNEGIGMEVGGSSEVVYLAAAATIACTVLTVFKCALYKMLRDNSILLDVINTVISTVFALSIVMSQVLINFDHSFWYLDPILSIVLALFMMGFGIKVLHQNLNILKPIYCNNNNNNNLVSSFANLSYNNGGRNQGQALLPVRGERKGGAHSLEGANNGGAKSGISGETVLSQSRNWQKTDYSTITFAP